MQDRTRQDIQDYGLLTTTKYCNLLWLRARNPVYPATCDPAYPVNSFIFLTVCAPAYPVNSFISLTVCDPTCISCDLSFTLYRLCSIIIAATI